MSINKLNYRYLTLMDINDEILIPMIGDRKTTTIIANTNHYGRNNKKKFRNRIVVQNNIIHVKTIRIK